MRTAVAYYWVTTGLVAAREVAVVDLKEALLTNPFAADLWLSLATYQAAGGEDASEAMKHVHALRPNVILKEVR